MVREATLGQLLPKFGEMRAHWSLTHIVFFSCVRPDKVKSLSFSPSLEIINFHVHLFLTASMAQHNIIIPYACAEAHDCLSDLLVSGSGYVGMNAELLLFVFSGFFVCFPPVRVRFHDFRGRVTKNLL